MYVFFSIGAKLLATGCEVPTEPTGETRRTSATRLRDRRRMQTAQKSSFKTNKDQIVNIRDISKSYNDKGILKNTNLTLPKIQ